MGRLAVFHAAAAFAFAGVLSRAAVVAALAAAFALTPVLPLAIVGLALLLVGERARAERSLARLRRGRRAHGGNDAAAEDACDGRAGEQCLAGVDGFHVC